jgi:hypothetical protein
MITEEVRKFLYFREELIRLLNNSFHVVLDEHDSYSLEGDTVRVADGIIGLIQKYEGDENVKVEY